MHRVITTTFLLSAWLIQSCSTCRNSAPFGIEAMGEQSAWVTTRICGSYEGWAVKVRTASGEEQEVFLGEMPDPTSVEDVREYVTVTWLTRDRLLVTTPRWIGGFKKLEWFGSIRIEYAPNDKPYPGIMERGAV
jgi:hypothetical protein